MDRETFEDDKRINKNNFTKHNTIKEREGEREKHSRDELWLLEWWSELCRLRFPFSGFQSSKKNDLRIEVTNRLRKENPALEELL